ncbi:MAG: hypothetical protein ABI813_09055 [Bacteroidota bacterium]
MIQNKFTAVAPFVRHQKKVSSSIAAARWFVLKTAILNGGDGFVVLPARSAAHQTSGPGCLHKAATGGCFTLGTSCWLQAAPA